MLLNPENQIKVLDALVISPKWKSGAAAIGASEETCGNGLRNLRRIKKSTCAKSSRHW